MQPPYNEYMFVASYVQYVAMRVHLLPWGYY